MPGSYALILLEAERIEAGGRHNSQVWPTLPGVSRAVVCTTYSLEVKKSQWASDPLHSNPRLD